MIIVRKLWDADQDPSGCSRGQDTKTRGKVLIPRPILPYAGVKMCRPPSSIVSGQEASSDSTAHFQIFNTKQPSIDQTIPHTGVSINDSCFKCHLVNVVDDVDDPIVRMVVKNIPCSNWLKCSYFGQCFIPWAGVSLNDPLYSTSQRIEYISLWLDSLDCRDGFKVLHCTAA